MNSTWNTNDLYVGNSGTGTLDIAAGGGVSNGSGYIGDEAGATGSVSVDGMGSTWTNSAYLRIGGSGDGTLNVTGGGQVTSTIGYVGNQTGSTGEVSVDGIGSTWTNYGSFPGSGNIYVGYAGDGTLQVTNGGSVKSLLGTIGQASTGNVLVSDASWEISFNGVTDRILRVGVDGNGELEIRDAGLVEIVGGYCLIADGTSSVSSVTVDGQGSTLLTRALLFANLYEYPGGIDIGEYGDGTLNITNGGVVQTVAYSEFVENQVEAGWAGTRVPMELFTLMMRNGSS